MAGQPGLADSVIPPCCPMHECALIRLAGNPSHGQISGYFFLVLKYILLLTAISSLLHMYVAATDPKELHLKEQVIITKVHEGGRGCPTDLVYRYMSVHKFILCVNCYCLKCL